MPDQNLIKYIKDNLAAGYTKEKIEAALLQAGWAQEQIKEAFAVLEPVASASSEPQSIAMPEQKKSINNSNLGYQLYGQPKSEILPSSNSIMTQSKVVFPSSNLAKNQGLPEVKSNFKAKYIYAVIIVVAFFGFGIGAYAYFSPTPDELVNSSIKNMGGKVNSFKYVINLEGGSKKIALDIGNKLFGTAILGLLGQSVPAKSTLESPIEGSVVFNSSGAIDFIDTDNIKIDASMDINISDPELTAFSVGLKKADDEFYFNVKNIPKELNMVELDDQWIRFSLKELQEEMNSSGLGDILPKNNATAPAQQGNQQQDEDLRALVARTSFFSIKEKMSDEKLDEDGVKTSTYHFKIAFNGEAIKNFFNEAAMILDSEKEYQSSQKEISQTIDELAKFDGEIWIGKSDRLFHKIIFTRQEPSADSKTTDYFSLTLFMFNYNKPVEVVEPKNFKTIAEVMKIIDNKTKEEAVSTPK